MRILLTPEVHRQLPVHDAEFITFQVTPVAGGDLKLSFLFKLHPDEPFTALAALGMGSRLLQFSCAKCWQITSNFLGTNVGNELVDDWRILEESALLTQLKTHFSLNTAKLRHHQVSFSGGSSLDILADDAFLEEVHDGQVNPCPSTAAPATPKPLPQ